MNCLSQKMCLILQNLLKHLKSNSCFSIYEIVERFNIYLFSINFISKEKNYCKEKNQKKESTPKPKKQAKQPQKNQSLIKHGENIMQH